MKNAAQFIQNSEGRIRAFMYSRTRNYHDTLELTQDVLLSAWEKIATLRDREKFQQWINRIAHNRWVSWVRERRRQPMVLHALPEPRASSPVDPCLKEEQRKQVDEALNMLTEKQRAVLLDYYVEKLSYEEIGRKRNLPINTVRSRLFKARRILETFSASRAA